MKRRRNSIVKTVSILLAVGAVCVMGCGSGEEQSTADGTVQQESAAEASTQAVTEEFTVTYYDSDGTTVLKETAVETGDTVEEYEPEKDGYTFVGWFATPQMSHAFDFTQEITGDTQLFAGFVSYAEDTRAWYILGSGTSPVLLESGWGSVIGEAQTLTKENNAEANIYTITLDLSEGDEFQFAINGSWDNQRGFGYMDTASLEGVEYFTNAGSLGDADSKRSNIKCAVSGNYTFTLTTYPAEDIYDTDNANYTEENKEAFNMNPYDTISWSYNGEAKTAAAELTTDYYIKGAIITDWQDVYTDETKFVNTDGIYVLTVELEEGDEFMFTSLVTSGDSSSVGTEYIRYTNIAEDDAESLSCVTGTESANLVAGKTGTYTFTYDPSTLVLTVRVE